MNSQIVSVWYFLPEMKLTSREIEEKINKKADFHHFPHGIIEHMTWVKNRYFVREWEYASDLAIEASRKAINKVWIDKNQIDLLIFASASQDIIEPATANIIQKWLGISCPVFDVKNACNSFLNGIDIADSMIKIGKYKHILICSGETPSKVIKYDVIDRDDFKNHFAWYTLWDAGAAMILSWTKSHKWIQKTFFYSDWSSWDLATIMWWWSRFPHDDKNYFYWDPGKIRDKFVSIGTNEFDNWLYELGWDKKDIKQIFVHQVAMSTIEQMIQVLWVERDKCTIVLPEVWNIASCCIPLAYARYTENHEVLSWDKFIFLWFASGFSYSIIYYES
jgi:3-oxoacyl-(acyl-carrier-protein) synthase III